MPRERQTPKIVRRGDQWFVMTRYKEAVGIDPQTHSQVPYLVALVEFEVTEQMAQLLKDAKLNELHPLVQNAVSAKLA